MQTEAWAGLLNGEYRILKRLPSTKHRFPKGTVFKLVEKVDFRNRS